MVNVVRRFITAHPSLANNDTELIWNVWKWFLQKKHNPSININSISARDLFKLIKDKAVPNWQNITRSRRKCQEMYPETRGETYSARHKESDNVKRQIRSMNGLQETETNRTRAFRTR